MQVCYKNSHPADGSRRALWSGLGGRPRRSPRHPGRGLARCSRMRRVVADEEAARGGLVYPESYDHFGMRESHWGAWTAHGLQDSYCAYVLN
jgi:hypothetical protein